MVNKYESQAPVPGSTVVLTLDMALQAVAQQALDDKITELRARPEGEDGQDVTSGSVVLLDSEKWRRAGECQLAKLTTFAVLHRLMRNQIRTG